MWANTTEYKILQMCLTVLYNFIFLALFEASVEIFELIQFLYTLNFKNSLHYVDGVF